MEELGRRVKATKTWGRAGDTEEDDQHVAPREVKVLGAPWGCRQPTGLQREALVGWEGNPAQEMLPRRSEARDEEEGPLGSPCAQCS